MENNSGQREEDVQREAERLESLLSEREKAGAEFKERNKKYDFVELNPSRNYEFDLNQCTSLLIKAFQVSDNRVHEDAVILLARKKFTEHELSNTMNTAINYLVKKDEVERANGFVGAKGNLKEALFGD
jgi:hypothetical protein